MEFIELNILSWFLLFLMLLGTLIHWYIRYALYWTSRGIQSIWPLPLIGNYKDFILMKKSPGEFVMSFYQKTEEPVLGIFVFHRPALFIRDPAWIKSILVKDFNMFQDRVSSTEGHNDALGSRNLFRIKNPLWKEMRVKLTPIFSTAKIKSMFPLITQVGQEFNNFLNETLKVKNVDNMRELCAKYTTDVITSCAFGIQANSFKNPNAEFRTIGKRIFAAEWKRALEISAFFFFPELVNILGFKLFERQGTKFLRKSFNEVLKEREKSGTTRHDLVDMLIGLKNIEASPGQLKFEGDTLVAQAAVFFAAGYEASSGAMSFTLYELALQPEIQQHLRSEILNKIKEHNGITYESIKHMRYLDMVLCETLRKYPTLPILDRMCNSSGYRLPAPYEHVILEPKTPIYISILGIHMDPKYYPNPNKYDPERFSDEMKQSRDPYTYMPFGAGPHVCIGERFGLLQTKVGLVYILKDFHVTPSAKTQIPLILDSKAFFLAPRGGINLQFEKINSNINI